MLVILLFGVEVLVERGFKVVDISLLVEFTFFESLHITTFLVTFSLYLINLIIVDLKLDPELFHRVLVLDHVLFLRVLTFYLCDFIG